jgi:hypothetical protein
VIKQGIFPVKWAGWQLGRGSIFRAIRRSGFVCYLTLSWGIVFRLGTFRGARGKYAKYYHAGTNLVLLDPDVRKASRSERPANYATPLVIELRIVRLQTQSGATLSPQRPVQPWGFPMMGKA